MAVVVATPTALRLWLGSKRCESGATKGKLMKLRSIAIFISKGCLAGLACTLSLTSHAAAFDVVAHVTQIEGSYVPNNLSLAIDQSAGACAAGPWLFFNGNSGSNNLPENITAMYAGLLAALESGNAVEVYGNDTGCLVTNVHFLNHP
jgi:hypothetical protein